MIRNQYAIASSDDLLLLRLLYALLAAFILVRIGLNALVLNQYMNYTTLEGSTIEKIHPAFYGIVAVAVALLLTQRIELTSYDAGVLRGTLVFMLGMGGLLAMLTLGGRSTSAGYLLDAYVVACICAFAMTAFPQPWRTCLGEMILMFMIVSAVVGIGEFALRARLLPYPGGEDVFRPTGLSDHPLELGQWCAVSICFIGVTRWRPVLKYAAVVVLFIGALASGARIASLAACLCCVAFLALEPLPSRTRSDEVQHKVMLGIVGLLAIVAIVAVMFAIGALNRFEGALVDQSALARVSIYGVFDYMTWSEFLFGADIGRIQRLALDVFGLPFIESSFVIFTVQFGLVGAILFALILANLFRTLIKGRRLIVIFGTVIFFILALTNNALSTKSADILVMTVLLMASGARPAPRIVRA